MPVQAEPSWVRAGWLKNGRADVAVALLVYAIATLFTGAFFAGDAPDYVRSIIARAQGVDDEYWEPGHLLWRPLGYVASRLVAPLGKSLSWGDERTVVHGTLITLAWLGGVLAVACSVLWVRRLVDDRRAVLASALLLVAGQAFLNFSQSGSSYVPALAFLFLGIWLLDLASTASRRRTLLAVAAGSALAGSVGFWLPMICALPAVLLAPMILREGDRKNVAPTAYAVIACGLAGSGMYFGAAMAAGVDTFEAFIGWLRTSSHGITIGGLPRVVIGLPRTLLNMGRDGMLMKRYLLHDPYNPVSLTELAKLGLWKIALFYATTASIVYCLFRSEAGRRVLVFAALNTLPVVALAVVWQGGDMERYFPMFPAVLLAFMTAFAMKDAPRWLRGVLGAFLLAVATVNARALALPKLNAERERSVRRIAPLQPRLRFSTMVVVPNWHDDLVGFVRNSPLHPINREGLWVYALVSPGGIEVTRWRFEFATRALETWRLAEDVWVSRRVLHQVPRSEWNWTEGDDARVSWTEIPDAFAALDLGEVVGGNDGFVLLLPTPRNKSALDAWAVDARRSGTGS